MFCFLFKKKEKKEPEINQEIKLDKLLERNSRNCMITIKV